eukprot:16481-Eustigmatos_ZCMA.PRE.1
MRTKRLPHVVLCDVSLSSRHKSLQCSKSPTIRPAEVPSQSTDCLLLGRHLAIRRRLPVLRLPHLVVRCLSCMKVKGQRTDRHAGGRY